MTFTEYFNNKIKKKGEKYDLVIFTIIATSLLVTGVVLWVTNMIQIEKLIYKEDPLESLNKIYKRENLFHVFVFIGILLFLVPLFGSYYSSKLPEPLSVNKSLVETVATTTPIVKEENKRYYFGKTDEKVYYIKNGALQFIKNEEVIIKKAKNSKSAITKYELSPIPNTFEFFMLTPKTVYEITTPYIYEYRKGISENEIIDMARNAKTIP